MKTWLIWLIAILAIVIVGGGLSFLIDGFGWVIGVFVGVLILIMCFKAKANAENKDQKVYDEY